MLIAFNKPYGVLSQFTPDGSANRPLAGFGFPKDVYPLGRLDADSEGLLLLSDERELNRRLLHPVRAHPREYWAEVERIPTPAALENLSRGVVLQGQATLPCRCWSLDPQPADTFPKERSDLLDRFGTGRRQKPAGPPHDRSHWTPHLAPGARAHWKLHAGRTAAR